MLDTEVVEELENGKILLFLRRGIYQARVYMGNKKYIYKTLKTRDVDVARKSAVKFYYNIEFRKEESLPLQKITFGKVLREYLAYRQKDYEQNKQSNNSLIRNNPTSIHMLRQIKRVSKFWLEYCSNISIEKIDNSKLQEYIQWRRDYYHNMPVENRPRNYKINPAEKTLEWEMTLAKTVIKWATEKGYRGNLPRPTYMYWAKGSNPRPTFTLTEYKKVIVQMRRRIKQEDNPRFKYSRELLRDYFLILANSGIRVGEANNLKESDIEMFVDRAGRKNWEIKVNGKTGQRIVIPRQNSFRYIERVFERNQKRKEEEKIQERIMPSHRRIIDNKGDWFFSMYDGNKIITLIDQFQDVLKEIDMLRDNKGQRYSLYSLRHFYAIQLLKKNKVDIHTIAKNMGTRVEMLQDYYVKNLTTREMATQLGG
jgi:integrase